MAVEIWKRRRPGKGAEKAYSPLIAQYAVRLIFIYKAILFYHSAAAFFYYRINREISKQKIKTKTIFDISSIL